MKVAFHCHCSNYNGHDLSKIEAGNPGIGGTEFMIIWAATALSRRDNDIDVILFVDGDVRFADTLEVKFAETISQAYLDADLLGCDYFVFDFKRGMSLNTLPKLSRRYTKIIPWVHTFQVQYSYESYLANPVLAKFIHVGKEQNELLIDHISFEKSEYIYNCAIIDEHQRELALSVPNSHREHVVTFIGSLTIYKNFHILAQLWPKILKRVPDAQLFVIGSGKLYDTNREMGLYGLASKEYEDKFIPYLIGNDGKILPSVHFVGNLGKEKFDILRKTKVGVPNPTGKGETFGICAVEMQAMGCYVVAMKSPGYLDTVRYGKLASSMKDLEDGIVEALLCNDDKIDDSTIAFLDQFIPERVIGDWELFIKSNMNQSMHNIWPVRNLSYRLKWLKVFMWKLKAFCPVLKPIRTVESFLRKIQPDNEFSLG